MHSDWKNVVIPGHLRNQFLEQFGKRLEGHLPKNRDRFKEVTIGEVLNAFNVADEQIGKHWPLLATNLWQYGSHVLLSAYIETSGTIGSALQGMLSTSTMLYPVFSPTSELGPDGLIMRGRPTYDMSARHWEIFQIFSLLAQTAVYKRFAPEETKQMVCHLTIKENELSETISRLATCKIQFDTPLDRSYYLYPFSLLNKQISHEQRTINDLLFTEIQRQTTLPEPEDNLANALRRTIYNEFPRVMESAEAAERLEISRSTLYRMLRKRNLSYAQIVTQLRREFILIHFSKLNSDKPHHEALGFPSPRALSKFCRANFGVPISKISRKI